jgi:pyruvate formate lyase activating enzyme
VCGACVSECYSESLQMKGEEKTVEEIFREIEKDAAFYKNSGGGYTLSGGEPLFQYQFCLELIKKCKSIGFHGAMETCGYGDTNNLVKLSSMLDLVYFDIKEIEEEKHKSLVGVSNKIIISNLKAIQECANEIIVRTPIIPQMNDSTENIKSIAELCNSLKKVQKLELLPYHRLGEHKYESLGKEFQFKSITPPEKKGMLRLAEIANSIMRNTGKECVINTSGLY